MILPPILCAAVLCAGLSAAQQHPVPDDERWLTYHGESGPGSGKHVVLVAAEQEYRSEQSMPMLAKVLAEHHGFDCTVLFAQQDGLVDPTQKTDDGVVHDIPGLEQLASADLLNLSSRFMRLPDEQIAHVITYLEAGKPLIGIRTANHGFRGNFPYRIDGKQVRFGEDVLGGTVLNHHGAWHRESTRGVIVAENREHPVLTGVDDVWGPSDVYRTFPEGESLPAACTPLLLGQPLRGLRPDDPANDDKVALPIAWTKTWTGSTGKSARVFHVTMGSARDFQSAGLRRLTVNAVYWCLGLEHEIAATSDVDPVGAYEPLESGFDYEKLGVVPKPVSAYR